MVKYYYKKQKMQEGHNQDNTRSIDMSMFNSSNVFNS